MDCGLPITSRANATFWWTFLLGSSRKSWNTQPIERRSAGTFQLRQPGQVLAGHVHLARARDLLLEQQAQERRLAGAARADEEDELALLDVDVDPVERGPRARGVALGHLLQPDHPFSLGAT